MRKLSDRVYRVWFLAQLLFKDILRRRLTLLLLFIIPLIFNLIILVTTSDIKDPVVFGILNNNDILMISRRSLSFVFLGVAAVSFLTSFLAFYLVHQRTEADRRLTICGYLPIEIVSAKLLVLLVIVLSVAIYEGLIIRSFIQPHHFELVLSGLFLGGLIYGCYGLFVGAISRHELEGIFLIVLLANIDVGWLQNPFYYDQSTNQEVIELLPGFFPIQLASLGAFTESLPIVSIWGSLLYAGFFLVAAVLAFWLRIGRQRSKRTSPRKYYIKLFLISYIIWIILFQIVGRYAATLETYDPTIFLDHMIPVSPNFIWFYEFCYFFPFLLLFVVKDFHRMNIVLISAILANLSAFVVYFAFPIAFPRPELGQSIAEQIMALEYRADFYPGANNLPSMHVTFAWLVYFGSRYQGLGKIGLGVVLFITIMITVSTLFVKQHMVLDVIAGILWAFLSWWVAKFFYNKFADPNLPPHSVLGQLFKKLFKF
jgi:membrane-associated phospholipid phosphatase